MKTQRFASAHIVKRSRWATMRKQDTSTTGSLWVLLFGNFIIGTGVLMPTGMLSEISFSFEITMATAVQLLTVSGIVIGFGAPFLAFLTNKMDRRTLLTMCLLLYSVGHIASALVSSFTTLMIIRAITVVAAAVFSPQAAATVVLLVSPDKRDSAIAFIFTGWALAVILGVPIASFASTQFSWEAIYFGLGTLSGLLGLGTWRLLQPRLVVAPLDFAAWKIALTHPQILATLSVTMLSVSGQFAVFSVLSPILSAGFDATPEQIPLAFVSAGIGGIVGSALASVAVGRFGNDTTSTIAILSLVVGIAVFALSFGNFSLGLLAILIWGLGSFSVTSLQQSRLVRIAPKLASATIALNTSALYLGQAIGVLIGSMAIQGTVSPLTVWLALPFVCGALIISMATPYFNRTDAANS